MQHLIKKQFIELTLDSSLDHFHIQQLVSSQYWSQMVPLLQKAFDTIGNEEEVIQLDKLEIDLGRLTVKSLEKNEWGRSLQSKIEAVLSSITHTGLASGTVMPTPKRLNVFQQWFFYMQNGYLPWNTINADEQWYTLVLEALAVDFNSVQLLRNAIEKDRNIVERIVARHPGFFLLKITEILTALKQDKLPAVIDELVTLALYLKKNVQEMVFTEMKIKSALWEKAISIAVAENFANTNRKLDEALIALFLEDNKIVKKIPEKLVSKLKLTSSAILKSIPLSKTIKAAEEQQFEEKIKKEVQKNDAGNSSFTPGKIAAIENNQQDFIPKNILFKDKLTDAKQVSTVGQFDTIISSIGEEGIFINNAGLVLIHPFLHSLFTRLNLINQGKFADKNGHQQSLYIMHYLATRKVEAEEHELVIAKILSDYPLQQMVEKNSQLSKEIMQEADDMIVAAIQQWDKLTGTSAAGLREGFLQRKGKLSSRNGKLYLQVEQSAIDILLDYLPWNLSMIKLPWMKNILNVEWR